MIDYLRMISRLRPGCSLGWVGDTSVWGGLVDYHGSLPAPTQAECDAEWAVIQTEEQNQRTARETAKTYYAGLSAYLDLTNPTGAQTIAALKALIRVVLWLARNELKD